MYEAEIAHRRFNSMDHAAAEPPAGQPSTMEETNKEKIVKQRATQLPEKTVVTLRMENLRLYGFGVYSNVYRGTLLKKEGNREIAIKKIWPRTKERTFELVFLLGENRRLHKNIIHLLYSWSTSNYEDNKTCESFVFDFMPDTLASVLQKGGLDQLDTKLYAWQLFSGLHYLSTMEIAHRDIKPVNLLIDHQLGLLKIADFGAAKIIAEGTVSDPYQVTRFYRAPEMLLSSKLYDWSVDVWAAGCCFGEMLGKKILFHGKNNTEMMQLIFAELGVPTAGQLKAIRAETQLSGAWGQKGDNFRKLSMAAKWLEAVELLKKILVFTPKERLSGLKLLNHAFFEDLFAAGARRKEGQPVTGIIYHNDIELAEKDELNRRAYIPKRESSARTVKSKMINLNLQQSCSGSDELAGSQRQAVAKDILARSRSASSVAKPATFPPCEKK